MDLVDYNGDETEEYLKNRKHTDLDIRKYYDGEIFMGPVEDFLDAIEDAYGIDTSDAKSKMYDDLDIDYEKADENEDYSLKDDDDEEDVHSLDNYEDKDETNQDGEPVGGEYGYGNWGSYNGKKRKAKNPDIGGHDKDEDVTPEEIDNLIAKINDVDKKSSKKKSTKKRKKSDDSDKDE